MNDYSKKILKDAEDNGRAYMTKMGIADAQKVFAETPDELPVLMRQWESTLKTMGDGMDKMHIAAFVAEAHRILGI